MPLYEYKCQACGKHDEKLEKVSAPSVQNCPYCQALTFQRQVSSTHFQLKGEGWYVTDFRDKNKPKPETNKTADDKPKPAADKKSDKKVNKPDSD